MCINEAVNFLELEKNIKIEILEILSRIYNKDYNKGIKKGLLEIELDILENQLIFKTEDRILLNIKKGTLLNHTIEKDDSKVYTHDHKDFERLIDLSKSYFLIKSDFLAKNN